MLELENYGGREAKSYIIRLSTRTPQKTIINSAVIRTCPNLPPTDLSQMKTLLLRTSRVVLRDYLDDIIHVDLFAHTRKFDGSVVFLSSTG